MTLHGHRRIARCFALLVVGVAAGNDLEVELASLDPSVLDRISATMLEGIGPERDADPARIAGHRLRSVVHELAAQGRRSTPAAPMAALAAIRLDAVMPDLQARLNALSHADARIGDPAGPLEPEIRARLHARLEVFNSMALDELRRRSTGSVADLDEALSLVLAPIRDVLEETSGRVLRSRWPERAASDEGRKSEDPLESSLAREITRRRSTDEGTDNLVEFLEGLRGSSATSQPSFAGSSVDVRRISELAERMGRIRDHRSDEVAALEELLQEVAIQSVSTDGADRLAALESCVSILEAETALEACPVPRDFRTINRRHIDRARRTLERAIDETASGAASVGPRLLTDLERSTRDLQALEVACDLLRELRMLIPQESAEAVVRLRTWLRELDRATTRDQALARFDRLEHQLARHHQAPGDRLISDPERSSNDLLADRGSDLSDRLQNARDGWAREIVAGTLDGPSSLELDRLHRLLQIVLESEPLLRNRSDAERPLDLSDRWAGAYLDPGSMSWTRRSLRPGIILAVNAAADGRSQRLSSDLERLERITPMVRLTNHLRADVGRELAGVPTGDLGAIAALSFPPSASARGIEQRRSLAIISRCLAEIAAARAREEMELADRLADELAEAVTELLIELEDSPSLPKPQLETDR